MKTRSTQELNKALQKAYRNPLPRSRDQSNRIRELLRDNQEVWPKRFKPLIEGTLASKAKRLVEENQPGLLESLVKEWAAIMGITKVCPTCSGVIHPKNIYRERKDDFCSVTCAQTNPEVRARAVSTELKKYGGSHNAHPDVQEKKQQTWMRTLGVLNPSKSPKVLKKIKRTWKAKYGHNIPFKDPLVAAKREETWLENYGTSHPWSNGEVSRCRQDTLERKYGARNPQQVPSIRRRTSRTTTDKYGGACSQCSPTVRLKTEANNLVKYGVRHPMQNQEVFARNRKAGFSLKRGTVKGVRFEGLQGFEPQAIRHLVRTEKVDPNIISAGAGGAGCFKYEFKGEDRSYYPDIFVPGKIGTYIEVKSEYTVKQDPECIKAKLRAVRDSGFRVRLMVMNKEGALVKNYQWEPLKSQPF